MIQTLTALMALMLTLLFIFNQQQGMIRAERTLIRNEISAQATAVAVDRLEEIGALPYDRSTLGEKSITDTTQLTPASLFGSPSPQDIDDFDGIDAVLYRVLWEDTLKFGVRTTVRYARETDPGTPSGGRRTKFKKATVVVFPLDEPFPDTVRIAQSFSCGSFCKW